MMNPCKIKTPGTLSFIIVPVLGDWYLPIELLRQPLALQKTPSLSHSHLTSIGRGVQVDGCVIDGGLWDIRIGGGGCHSRWGGGVRRGGRGVRGGEGGATRTGL